MMSGPGVNLGGVGMLRTRRRDMRLKPNRKLDKKSARGMIYENEELRLRTIHINAEVEQGQNDIKKLRKENEQLKREIWCLRNEYEKLERTLRKQQSRDNSDENEICSEEESEFDVLIEEEEEEEEEDGEEGEGVEEEEEDGEEVEVGEEGEDVGEREEKEVNEEKGVGMREDKDEECISQDGRREITGKLVRDNQELDIKQENTENQKISTCKENLINGNFYSSSSDQFSQQEQPGTIYRINQRYLLSLPPLFNHNQLPNSTPQYPSTNETSVINETYPRNHSFLHTRNHLNGPFGIVRDEIPNSESTKIIKTMEISKESILNNRGELCNSGNLPRIHSNSHSVESVSFSDTKIDGIRSDHVTNVFEPRMNGILESSKRRNSSLPHTQNIRISPLTLRNISNQALLHEIRPTKSAEEYEVTSFEGPDPSTLQTPVLTFINVDTFHPIQTAERALTSQSLCRYVSCLPRDTFVYCHKFGARNDGNSGVKRQMAQTQTSFEDVRQTISPSSQESETINSREKESVGGEKPGIDGNKSLSMRRMERKLKKQTSVSSCDEPRTPHLTKKGNVSSIGRDSRSESESLTPDLNVPEREQTGQKSVCFKEGRNIASTDFKSSMNRKLPQRDSFGPDRDSRKKVIRKKIKSLEDCNSGEKIVEKKFGNEEKVPWCACWGNGCI